MTISSSDLNLEKPCTGISVKQLQHTQDFGVLIAVEKGLNRISHVSENIEKSFGISIEKVLGESILAFCDHPLLGQIADHIGVRTTQTPSVETISCAPTYELLCHEQDKHVIFEWVFFHAKDEHAMLENFQKVVLFFDEMRKSDFNHALQETCKALKDLLSFDKVLIYHFRNDGHGDVLGEACEEGMDKYLGLRFPATDVPVHVREVYMENSIRIIQNVQARPVKIHALSDQPILDMTQCLLKGIAPIHQGYVQAMKLTTSISYAIKSQGNLWGLLCFHHRTPKELCYQERILLGLVSQLIEIALDVQNKEKKAEFYSQVTQILFRLADEYVKTGRDLTEIFIDLGDSFMKLFGIEGCCISFENKLKLKGKTPECNLIKELINWLSEGVLKEGVFATDNLMEHYPAAKEYVASASGIMAFNIGPDPTDMIIWFRPDQITHVLWGGNPNRNHAIDQQGYLLADYSFALWQEAVYGKSNGWRSHEISAAKEIQTFMKTVIFELLNARMSKQLQALNKQKDSFLQMAAHDLRNPLAGILEAVDILRSQSTEPALSARLVDIIQRQGQSMLVLLNELLDASVIESLAMQIKPEKTNLPEFFRDITTFNIILFEKKGVTLKTSFQFDGDDVMVDKNKIKQVVENLLSNALKYSRAGTCVTLSVQASKKALSVEVKDQGIGIPEGQHGLVFVPLSKLSPKPTGGESSHGIGLSICKKIIDAYDGKIDFTSLPGVGSTFDFTVPLVQIPSSESIEKLDQACPTPSILSS